MKAPAKEKKTTKSESACGKKIKQSAKPKEDPLLIPNKPESANGFLVIPCIKAPLTAKALPTKKPAKIRGNLIFRIICCV